MTQIAMVSHSGREDLRPRHDRIGHWGELRWQVLTRFPASRVRRRKRLAGLIGRRPFGTAPAGKIAHYPSFAQINTVNWPNLWEGAR